MVRFHANSGRGRSVCRQSTGDLWKKVVHIESSRRIRPRGLDRRAREDPDLADISSLQWIRRNDSSNYPSFPLADLLVGKCILDFTLLRMKAFVQDLFPLHQFEVGVRASQFLVLCT